jgi:hypothetical protein
MLSLFLALFCAHATVTDDLARAPKSFVFQNSKAVYIDILEAHYRLDYDIAAKVASVDATLRFATREAGYPMLDFVQNPQEILLNGVSVQAGEVQSPDRATKMRVIAQDVSMGEHILKIKLPLTALIEWSNGGVSSAFWTSDLSERSFIEKYIPTNLEYDRYPMSFDIKFRNSQVKQAVYANGDIEFVSDQQVRIQFPAHFNASALFFHTTPEAVMRESRLTFNSMDGRQIPVRIYLKPSMLSNPAKQLKKLEGMTLKILAELEADYGPFPHPSVTIYNAGSGGMEYHGATMTSESALGHELIHSYFARGMMPANGNAGWIDEAIASWRDNGYPRGGAFSGNANMAGRAEYTRFTDRQAYSFGAKFMASLDNHLKDQGGLRPMLKQVIENHLFSPFLTEDFVSWIEGFSRTNLMPIFERHVYAPKKGEKSTPMTPMPHVHHQKMSLEELAQFL